MNQLLLGLTFVGVAQSREPEGDRPQRSDFLWRFSTLTRDVDIQSCLSARPFVTFQYSIKTA